jgi:hypothetical protein
MTMRLGSPIAGRIIQVLKDYLPAELALIDAEEGGDATPLPGTDGWWDWDRPLLTSWPAIRIRDKGFAVLEIYASQMGSRVNAIHDVDILYDFALNTAAEDAESLIASCKRAAAGIVRVLCVMHEGLDTVADPIRWPGLESVKPTRADYGPQQGQGTGQQARTAVVSLAVQRIETR